MSALGFIQLNRFKENIMALDLESLLNSVKDQIVGHVQQGGHTGFDTNGLLSKISDLFANHQQSSGGNRTIQPSSRDPYGDPADQRAGGSNVKPASQDPYGDPADQKSGR